MPKQAPINAFYYVCYPPPVDVQTSPTLVHGAKVVNYFELSKKKCFWGCFFWCRVYGVECEGGDLLGGVPPSTKPAVEIKHVHSVLIRAQLLVNYLRILGNLFRTPINLFRKAVNYFKEQYSNTSYNWRSCLPCTALPFSHTAAYPRGVRHSMYCA